MQAFCSLGNLIHKNVMQNTTPPLISLQGEQCESHQYQQPLSKCGPGLDAISQAQQLIFRIRNSGWGPAVRALTALGDARACQSLVTHRVWSPGHISTDTETHTHTHTGTRLPHTCVQGHSLPPSPHRIAPRETQGCCSCMAPLLSYPIPNHHHGNTTSQSQKRSIS